LSTKNPTWNDFELNPDLHCEIQTNNRIREFVNDN
jgi:hypothetical protein